MKNKDPLGFDAGLARLARYVPEAQDGEEDDAQARTENKDPGNGGSPQARLLPSPRDPMAVARTFLAEKATDDCKRQAEAPALARRLVVLAHDALAGG